MEVIPLYYKPFHFKCIEYGTYYYNCRVSKRQTTWYDAETKCKAVGGRLFEPRTKAHNDEVATNVVEIMDQASYWFWLGISLTNGEWIYNSDGSEVNFVNWRSGEGNGGSSQNCSTLYTRPDHPETHHGRWWDEPCTWGGGFFICEVITTTTTTTSPLCPGGQLDADGNCCVEGICCPPNHVNSFGICCPANHTNSDGLCCPTGLVNSFGLCCPEGFFNSNGNCVKGKKRIH